LGRKSGLQLQGEHYSIVSTEPEKQKEWIRTQKLTVILAAENKVKAKPVEASVPPVIQVKPPEVAATGVPPAPEVVIRQEEKPKEPELPQTPGEPVVRKPELTSIPWQEKPVTDPQIIRFGSRSGKSHPDDDLRMETDRTCGQGAEGFSGCRNGGSERG
jgi:hypothetical protein